MQAYLGGGHSVKNTLSWTLQDDHMGKVLPSAQDVLREYAEQGMHLRQTYFAKYSQDIENAARLMATALAQGGKVLLCGNGGSAADAQHIAGELVNRFLLDRPPLPAIALTTDTSVLTAIANDFGFEQIFSKQVQALGKEGDVLIGISTSGTSPNVLAALGVAKAMGLHTIGLVGTKNADVTENLAQNVKADTGQMAPLCDILLPVPHACTPLVQELHIATGHMLCHLVDYFLFKNVKELQLDQENI